jgi:hypothetical protein
MGPNSARRPLQGCQGKKMIFFCCFDAWLVACTSLSNSLLGDMSFARGRYGTTQVPNLVSHKLIINFLGIAKKHLKNKVHAMPKI